MPDFDDLPELVQELSTRHVVPGCAVAVTQTSGAPIIAVAGLADVRHGGVVSPETLFRIGSVTKVFTATLVMRAVSEGKLALDDRIGDLIPRFALQDSDAANRLTLRHVLSKTDGVYDHVEGFGSADDCVERYIASLASVGQAFAPGDLYGYTNTGAIIAARVLELAYDAPFDDILDELLLRACRLRETMHIPGNLDLEPAGEITIGDRSLAARHTVDATGHARAGGGGKPPALAEPRAMAACGTTLAASIVDLISFVRLHLAGHEPPWLAPADRRAMQQLQIEVPEVGTGSAIGWAAPLRWPGVLWHNGGSRPPGTFAQVTIVPDRGIGLAVVANAMTGAALSTAVHAAVFADCGINQVPTPFELPPVTSCIGAFERGHARFTVSPVPNGALHIRVDPGPLGDQDVKAAASGVYEPAAPPWFHGPGGYVTFIRPDDDGRAMFLHDGRAARRVA